MLLQQTAAQSGCSVRRTCRTVPFTSNTTKVFTRKLRCFAKVANDTHRPAQTPRAQSSASQAMQHTVTSTPPPSVSSHQIFLTLGLVGGLALCMVDSAQAADLAGNAPTYHPTEISQLAENEEFWPNVLRYGRYFFTVTTGGLYVLAKPFLGLFKKPTTAVLAIVLGVGGVYLLRFTLNAMLGIEEPFEYMPSSAVTYGVSPYQGNF